jgi:hypothetical protein
VLRACQRRGSRASPIALPREHLRQGPSAAGEQREAGERADTIADANVVGTSMVQWWWPSDPPAYPCLCSRKTVRPCSCSWEEGGRRCG